MNQSFSLEIWRRRFPQKFCSEDEIFQHVQPGARIFIGTGCGEPQYLAKTLIEYVKSHPQALLDAELVQVWNLGLTPYADEKFQENFRLNSFFIGDSSRNAVNSALADYTPIFLSSVPDLFRRKAVPLDVALIQVSPPDEEGNMSLGISVDMVKAAIESASVVVAQVNSHMPFVYGDGVIRIEALDKIVTWDEPLLQYQESLPGEIAIRIGKHVARIIRDGDTIQAGYGSVPDSVLYHLKDKKNLGLHSELFSNGAAELMRLGAVDNCMKSLDKGKSVAAFCMGRKETYQYLHKNTSIEFRTIDYTNNPLVIARQRGMVAINSALEIDLTGQATAESLGGKSYSGIGGQADFMRAAVLAPEGKSILALPSTSRDGRFSRIVPQLGPGASSTLHRGDARYVVTEYGIAYLYGKNIRERAMDLIAIAHPRFRSWLVQEAKNLFLIYSDQKYIPGEYPANLETYKTTKTGLRIFLRPVKMSDEPLLKDFFYSLSDRSMYQRFASARKDMPHRRLQEFVAVDYGKDMLILAIIEQEEKETVVGMGQYSINQEKLLAELALVVRDGYQKHGIGYDIQSYLTYLAKRNGLLGFTAEVMEDNLPALKLLEKAGFKTERQDGDVREMILLFDRAKEGSTDD